MGLAAAITVLLATWLSLPISTTHALVGANVGAGVSAQALNWGPILDVFFKPLIVAPMLAVVVAAFLYVIFRFVRLRATLG